jgi:cystathionine gamma-lyase
MRGFGGMITFYLKGETPEVNKFARTLHVFTCAESLGGVESLMEIPVNKKYIYMGYF